MDLCTAQQSECLRSLCIGNGEASSLCGPVILRVGLVSTIWPFRSRNLGPYRSIWNATKIMKLDEFAADELMRTDMGLSEDKDWIYEDEAEMRRAIEEYLDVLCSDSAEFSENEVCACFDGIARPEQLFEEMLLLDADNDDEAPLGKEDQIPWVSALCSAVICNLRREYRFVQKTAVLLAYLHRAGVDWVSSSQSQLFSTCLRRLVKSRIMLRVASMRIVSLPHRASVAVRASLQQNEKQRLRVGKSLISQFVRSVTISELRLGSKTRARQISSVQRVTGKLQRSTLSILDLVGSAVRVHFIATQYLHISSDSLLCSRLRVAIADSSLLLAQKTTRVLGSSAGIGSVEENFEDASSNFVQAVRFVSSAKCQNTRFSRKASCHITHFHHTSISQTRARTHTHTKLALKRRYC